MEFNVKDFCEDPTLEKLQNQSLKKDDWCIMAQNFSIGFPNSATKEDIKNTEVEALVLNNYLPNKAIDLFTPATSSNPDRTEYQLFK